MKRFLVIGLATALAVAVFAATLLVDTAVQPVDVGTQRIDDPLDTQMLRGLKSTDATDPRRDPKTPGIDPRGKVQKYRVKSTNSKGQRVELFGDSLNPLPHGVTEVTSPGARIHLTDDRVLEILAKSGILVAPDNQPRSGDFTDRVVITLYEKSAGRPLELSPTSADAKFNAFLSDARFDMELGQIESDGALHLTTDSLDFRGVGLEVIYNDRRDRLDRLVVRRGRSLRFKSDAGDPDASSPGTSPVSPDAHTPGTEATRRVSGSQQDRSSADPPESPATSGPIQHYRARFNTRVTIRSQGNIVEADRLEVVFSLNAAAGEHELLEGMGLLPRSGSAVVMKRLILPGGGSFKEQIVVSEASAFQLASGVGLVGLGGPLSAIRDRMVAFVLTQPLAPMLPPMKQREDLPSDWPEDRTLAVVSPDDVIITWDGPLTVEPEDSPPIDLAGPEDVLIQLVGRPIRVTTQRDEVITAASADYLASDGRLRLLGSYAYPMRIDSPQLGVLTGEKLVIDQRQAIGHVVGPGDLRAHSQPSRDHASAGTEPGESLSPPVLRDMTISWDDALELVFYAHKPTANAVQQHTPRLRGIKHAAFRGQVRVHEPQLRLASDELTIALADPDAAPHAVETIQAQGGVVVEAQLANQQEPMRLRANGLMIDLARDTKQKLRPSHLQADGNVVAAQGRSTLQADRLEIELDSPPHPEPDAATPDTALSDRPADGGDAEPPFAVRAVKASGTVWVSIDDPKVRLWSDQLTVDGQTQQVELFGNSHAPARVEQPEGYLAGHHIIMNPQQPSVHVAGPGQFAYMTSDNPTLVPAPDAGDEDNNPPVEINPSGRRQPWGHQMNKGMAASSHGDRAFWGSDGDRSDQTIQQPDRVAAQSPTLNPYSDDDAFWNRSPGAAPVSDSTRSHDSDAFWTTRPEATQPSPVASDAVTTEDVRRRRDAQYNQGQGNGIGNTETMSPASDASVPHSRKKAESPSNHKPSGSSGAPQVAWSADGRSGWSGRVDQADGDSARISVQWSRAMHFDDRAGVAQFVGDAVALGQVGQQTMQLSADDLRLKFTHVFPPEVEKDPASPSAVTRPVPDQAEPWLRAGRVVSAATARGKVVFEAEKWIDQPHGTLETRLRLSGPMATFDHLLEQIQIIGPGTALIEDYRSADPPPQPADALAENQDESPASSSTSGWLGFQPGQGVALASRGVTLMKWSGQLLLDANHNDLQLVDQVQVMHRPADSRESIQLDSQRLLADLEATGGLAVWFSGEAPQPTVKVIRADRHVRILTPERTFLTDHLIYTGFDQNLVLQADPGRVTTMHQHDHPSAFTAESFRWDLVKNRVDIRLPGAGRMPLQ